MEEVSLLNEEEYSHNSSATEEESETACPENSMSESVSSSEEVSKETVDESQSEKCEMLDYTWVEERKNKNQTCDIADGYSNRVEGGNFEEKDALKEGDGEQAIEGDGTPGTGSGFEKTVIFPHISQDSTKLINLLRVVLDSNKVSKYKGDYKSGKKLNLKKIIPYIASDFRKDRIWMKRQRSDKKEYILRIFIDNSKSMFDQKLIDMLSSTYYKISEAFSMLGIPVELYKFGLTVQPCKIEDLTFSETTTLINWTDDFSDGINVILTDGIFQSVGYHKDNFLVVMIDKGNIKRMSKVTMIDNKVFVEKYLDSFKLNYCILENIDDLERVFIESLSIIIKNIY